MDTRFLPLGRPAWASLTDALSRPAPHFVGLGVQKGGTTWLYAQLQRHRQVWVPPRKELHHFDRDRGETRADQLDQLRQVEAVTRGKPALGHVAEWMRTYAIPECRNQAWYRSLFTQGRGRICGELTPAYLSLPPQDLQKLLDIYTHGPLFVVLRHPVDRMLSHYRMWIQNASNPHCTHTADGWAAFCADPTTAARSRNAGHLARYLDKAPGRVVPVFNNDIAARPAWVVERLCATLCIDPENIRTDALFKRVNPGGAFELPDGLRTEAAKYVMQDAVELAALLGGHAASWAQDVVTLADG